MRSFEGYATNGKFSVGCSGASVYIYDREGNELKRFRDFPYAYRAVFCPDKNVVIVKSTDNWLGFYDLNALCLLKKIPVGKKGKRAQCTQNGGFCISPGGDKFLNIEQYMEFINHIVVYDLNTYEESERYPFSSKYHLLHIEYSEQEKCYLLLGGDREKDYDNEFIAKFKDGCIYDEVYLNSEEKWDLNEYKNIEISGFTKETIEWSNVEYKEKIYNALSKAYEDLIKPLNQRDENIFFRKKVSDAQQKYEEIMEKYRDGYEKEIEFVKTTFNNYQGKFTELEKYLKDNTVHIRYGKGSTMQRGYFGPSIIGELVVGGEKRGRLYTNKSRVKDADTYYYFDGEGKLTGVASEIQGAVEYILHEGNISIGLSFDNKDHELMYITKCEYDEQERLKSTLISDYQNSDEDMGSDYQKEIYIYDEERLSAAVVYGLPKTYEFPGFITEIFSDWMKETDKKMWDDDWWKEPDIYEFVYDEKGKPTKCFVVDPKTGKREGYRLSFNSYVHVEELKRIYKPVFR